jgi:hypothetical protein
MALVAFRGCALRAVGARMHAASLPAARTTVNQLVDLQRSPPRRYIGILDKIRSKWAKSTDEKTEKKRGWTNI